MAERAFFKESKLTTRDIISRAYSLADLQNSKAITAADESDSLNEAYRDIYEQLLNNDDDYYLKRVDRLEFDGQKENFEYFFNLPDDFYRIRTVDYKYNGFWCNCTKFALSQRNQISGSPQYRIQNKQLVIVSGIWQNVPDVRISYYPRPKRLIPADTKKTETIRIDPVYTEAWIVNDGSVFAADRSDIFKRDGNGNYRQLFRKSDNRNSVFFANGEYFYARFERANTTERMTIVDKYDTERSTPLQCTTHHAVSYDGKSDSIIFICESLNQTYQKWIIQIDGTNTLEKEISLITDPRALVGEVFYLPLAYNGTGAALSGPPNVRPLFDLNFLDTKKTIKPYRTSSKMVLGLENHTGIFDPGEQGGVIISLSDLHEHKFTGSIVGASKTAYSVYDPASRDLTITHMPDESEIYDLEYPANAIYQIIAYQCAIDFRSKQGAAEEQLTSLRMRKAELYNTLMSSINRDDGSYGRINNYYAQQPLGLYGLR